jgi:(methylthio)acryloyl-CoA hydratase
MAAEPVTYELQGNVAVIGVNRPDKRNAINLAVLEGLSEAAIRA